MNTCARKLPAIISLLAASIFFSSDASAGLFGVGNTVQAFYFNGVFASPEGELTSPTGTTDPTPLTSAVHYIQGAADGSTVGIGDTQVVFTNVLSNAPFC